MKTRTRLIPVLRGLVDPWTAGTLVVAILASVPIVAVVVLALRPDEDIWSHLASTVLPNYVATTLTLMFGVGLGTLIIGTGTAWLVTMCRFPGRGIFEWAMLLPMAMPTYVTAYVYTDILEYAGPVQAALRDLFGWHDARDYWFPEIRSLGGAIGVMTLVLYPYVYLLARSAFLDQATGLIEASRTLGRGPWRSFLAVSLPLSRPALVIGVSLALMETLNDFGTVDFFAVPTFTAGIIDVWLNVGSASGAAQMACVLLLFVLALVAFERGARRGRKFHATARRAAPTRPYHPSVPWRAAALLLCAVPVILGFVLPAGILVDYALDHYQATLEANYLRYTINSLFLSAAAAAVTLVVGSWMAYGGRITRGRLLRGAARFASLGYAVPGAVLAIGVILPTAWLDNAVDAAMRRHFGVSTGLLLSGTVVVVVIGYAVRYMALAYGTMESGLSRITEAMEGAARTLGATPLATLRRVHLPLLRGSFLTAALLVFVEGMKELPMTMILRPFNFETLAAFVHQYASDELLEECALGALTIVAAGILPVIFLSITIGRTRSGSRRATWTR